LNKVSMFYTMAIRIIKIYSFFSINFYPLFNSYKIYKNSAGLSIGF